MLKLNLFLKVLEYCLWYLLMSCLYLFVMAARHLQLAELSILFYNWCLFLTSYFLLPNLGGYLTDHNQILPHVWCWPMYVRNSGPLLQKFGGKNMDISAVSSDFETWSQCSKMCREDMKILGLFHDDAHCTLHRLRTSREWESMENSYLKNGSWHGFCVCIICIFVMYVLYRSWLKYAQRC